ncbi:Uncharacterized protein OBRU01_02525 [Operophtera brumata]|uniref:Uncharacterized protein n=1 Tax=Operophtera brumata TaxID=104452 RepID=A0A0L7LQL8_OPEBR|nr:Uncharacterized protein OBRU01_02525 [Operophtera brumata]
MRVLTKGSEQKHYKLHFTTQTTPLAKKVDSSPFPSNLSTGFLLQNRNKELVKDTTPPRSSRPSSRRPIARVDATTYRPQLKPGTGPLAASPDSSPHTSLHRRADNYTPATAQLIIQEKDQSQKHQQNSEQDAKYKDEHSNSGVEQTHYQYKQETNAQDQRTVTHSHDGQQQQSLTVPAQAPTAQHHHSPQGQSQQAQIAQNQNQQAPIPQTQNQYYQQEKSQEIYQEHYQEPDYQPQHQYLNPYYQTHVSQNQNPYYRPQIFDQRAYEHRAFELFNHRQYQPLAQPLQYRLVPYNTGRY